MGPQCEDGYTKIANELLEALCRFRISGESMQVFLTILRKTYGFGKKSDMIALSQFAEATGIGKPNVVRALRQLSTLNLILVEKGSVISYGINKHHETWIREKREKIRPSLPKPVIKIDNDIVKNDNDSVIKIDNASLSETIINVIEIDNKPLSKLTPTKERKEKKETTTKEKVNLLEICEAWKAFVEMRKSIKKQMTEYAMRLRVKELFRLYEQGYDPIEVLNQSTASNYQDLYPTKEKTNGRRDEGTGTPKENQRRPGFIEANGPDADWLGTGQQPPLL